MLHNTANVTSLNVTKYSNHDTILVLILTIGATANIVALISIIALIKLNKNQSMTMNILTIALIITDLFGLTTVLLPSIVSYHQRTWLGGGHLCKYQSVIATCCILSSGCLSTVMASDRLTAIRNPFFYQKHFTHKQSKVSIAYAWILSFIISILPLFGLGGIRRYNLYCTINWFATGILDKLYSFFYGIFGTMLVFVVVSSNVRIVMTGFAKEQRFGIDSFAHSQSIVIKGGSNPYAVRRRSSSTAMKQQLAKIAIAISILFPVCWLPFMVRVLSNQAGIWKNDLADVVAWELLLLSLVINPFLYAFSRRQCREGLRHVLKWVISRLCPYSEPVMQSLDRRQSCPCKQDVAKPRTWSTFSRMTNTSATVDPSMILNDFVAANSNHDRESTDSTSFTEKGSPEIHTDRMPDNNERITEKAIIHPVLLGTTKLHNYEL